MIYDNKTENFANARIISNMFENVIQIQANRVIEIKSPSKDELQEITVEDVNMLEKE